MFTKDLRENDLSVTVSELFKPSMAMNIQMFATDDETQESDDTLDIDVDDLFKEEDDSQSSEKSSTKQQDMTKTMSNRINAVKAQTEKETRERVAKELGYDSYEAMRKAQETELIRQNGFDPDDIEAVLEPLIKQRLADDPRLKKLEAIEQRERDAYVQAQLAAINETTGQSLKITDLPQATLDLWAKGIELEQAYYATQGKTIITKGLNQINNGSMSHLAPSSGAGTVKMRRLTEQEKALYRSIVPGITEEELNKKTTSVTK